MMNSVLLAALVISAVNATPLTLSPVSAERFDRSGGFPKFPAGFGFPGIASMKCGTRAISHHPHRSGGITPKIVGGSSAPYGAYPWQVEIKVYDSEKLRYEHHCGGAVVGERLVLTAAHCITNVANTEQLRVVVGKHDISTKDKHERTFKPAQIVIHPDFRKAGYYSNDIAVIKVKATSEGGIRFNSFIQPICLPDGSKSAGIGDWCTVTGWGAQKPEDQESLSVVLRAASVPLLDLETCRQSAIYGGRHQPILDSMICAGPLEGGVDACGGDSGGPLACQINGRFVLTGVVSWGDGCAKRNRPGVYTRVAHYTPWITQILNELG